MGMMRQQKLLADGQQICVECGVKFVPFHRDLIRSWNGELPPQDDWLHSVEWASDNIYKENLRYCSPVCIELSEAKRVAIEIQEHWHRFSHRYRK